MLDAVATCLACSRPAFWERAVAKPTVRLAGLEPADHLVAAACNPAFARTIACPHHPCLYSSSYATPHFPRPFGNPRSPFPSLAPTTHASSVVTFPMQPLAKSRRKLTFVCTSPRPPPPAPVRQPSFACSIACPYPPPCLFRRDVSYATNR